MSIAATGFASGDSPSPELAVAAVRQALARMGEELPGSVLLFLTPHFARGTQSAVTAAAKAARCLQVAGCTAPGVFTESDWSLDQPAAASLVVAGGIGLGHAEEEDPALTLITRTADVDWSEGTRNRFGLLSTDAEGGASGRVWMGAKVAHGGICEAAFGGVRLSAGVSRGLRLLSPPHLVTEADGHELFELDGRPALAALRAALPSTLDDTPPPPISHIFAALPDASIDPRMAIAIGRYGLLPVVSVSEDEQSVTMAMPLAAGERLLWAVRQPAAAQADTAGLLNALAKDIPRPDFAMLFACIGRGPYFFGGEDLDRAAIGERFPALPIIGAYGGGEIAPLPGGSALISYSAVVALAAADVQS